MNRPSLGIILLHCAGWATFGQPAAPRPKFEIADVHASAKTTNPFFRALPPHDGRYELKFATMVDLVRTAYEFDPDKVLGGPNWLEMDRFDILAKLPPDSTAESQKLMLQSLLEDRFKLVVHKDTKPLPTYALVLGKKPQLKESDGTGESGCHPQSASGPAPEGGVRLMMTTSSNSTPVTLNLGPGMLVQYNCRNMTMAAFANGLRGMIGTSLGPNPVLDETGLKGTWNFDVRWSLQIFGPAIANTGERVTIFEAVEKQLGLKLEERQVPTPVIIVDRVNQKPTDNPPGLSEALPVPPAPTEFEVASVKPTDPADRGGNFQMQPGGRLNIHGMTLQFLLSRAFNINNNDQLIGVPGWASSERFDVIAKTSISATTGPMTQFDTEAIAPLIRNLLADRFKMTYHTEDRPMTAYTLVANKPKMKKADPTARTTCKNVANAPGVPPGTRVMTCQNITMAQFAERLQNMGPGLNWPILDSTGLDGSWDFTLSFSQAAMMNAAGLRGGDSGQGAGAAPAASDPTGGYTIFEAIEKQLGLKLEAQKRPQPVFVIDHIEQKPKEN